MRIAFNALGLNPNHNGGAESVFINLIKGFVGHNVSNDIVFFCYPEMEQTIKQLTPNSECVVIEHPQKQISRLDMLKIQSFVFHKIYKKYDVDVILFANADVGIFKYNVPTAVIPHDIQYVSRPEINKNKLQYLRNYYAYKLIFKLVDRIVCISNLDKKEIERCYPFASSKTIRIYDPIDTALKDSSFTSSKGDYILAVNIQYPHKNIETLLRAFSCVRTTYPELSLKLVGAQNEYTRSLEELANELEISEKVEFLGFISKEQLDSLWSSTKLYINPSLYEGFGMTSVESVFHGAPTLLSDLEVNHEVTDNLCSYYMDLENPKALTDAIIKMLECDYDVDESKRKADILVEKYSIENISRQYLDMLELLME